MKETINYENGVYVGEIKGGEPHGQGTLTLHERFKYVGEFRAGKFHGRGTKTSVNGEVFDGYWKNGLQDGEGFHEGELGSYYGQFQNDCFHGHGVMTYPDGSKITGEFKEGKLDGFAIWEGEDIKVEDKVASGKLAGHYRKGELVGEGIQTNPDGTQTWVVFRGDDIYKEPVETIREGIQAYKQILEILISTEKMSKDFKTNPLINFKNKEAYPIEYQIFMEEIGPISIGHEILFLNVTSPLNNNEFKTWLKYDGFAWWEDDEDLDDYRVFIGHECDSMPIFFKTDKVPYTLENDIHEDSFFIDLIDSTLCEYIIPGYGCIHDLELSEAKLEEIYRLADKFQSTKERIEKIRSMPIVKDGYVEGGQTIKANQLSKESLEHLDNIVKDKIDEQNGE